MKFQIVIDNDDDHEHRKYHRHSRHSVVCGNFYDENGPYFREHGLVHLSDNLFCQKDALDFIQKAADSGKITLEEACALGRDPALLLLPEDYPSGLALAQKNAKARLSKLELTLKGKKDVTELVVADSDDKRHAFDSFLSRILGRFGLRILSFFKKTPREIRKQQMLEIQKRNAKKAQRKNE